MNFLEDEHQIWNFPPVLFCVAGVSIEGQFEIDAEQSIISQCVDPTNSIDDIFGALLNSISIHGYETLDGAMDWLSTPSNFRKGNTSFELILNEVSIETFCNLANIVQSVSFSLLRRSEGGVFVQFKIVIGSLRYST